jgi:putative peptide zinc metalloprotease protein
MDFSSGEPRFRTDLVVSERRTPEGLAFVLKDPTSGRFFRLRETDYFVARLLDGSTSAETIRRAAEERFGASFTLEGVERFTAHLDRLGLLQTAASRAPGSTRIWHRIRGTPLYIRLKVLDPDRLLERLVRVSGFLFTPYFVASSALLILIAAGLTIDNWSEISQDFQRLSLPHTLALAWLTVLTVSTLHEFAHGLTCKHFGGEVREMGVMLIYFQPAFYCNVSDAWLFAEKGKRLWVSFAGTYLEIFLWALATLAWRMTEPESILRFPALVVMATSGIKTLFNLNPLIKLDGYYFLSDYLEVPNLRSRAFAYLKAAAMRLWKRSGTTSDQPSARERRIYVVYGLLASAYSIWLLDMVLTGFWRYLTHQFGPLGMLLFLALLVAVFQHPLARVPSWLRSHVHRYWQRQSPVPNS